MNGIRRWAETRRVIASWAAARPRFSRWATFGLVACTAAGYGITFGWLGEGPHTGAQETRELARQEAVPNALPEIRRLPATRISHLSADACGNTTRARDASLQPANYLLALATVATAQAPTVATPEIDRFTGEGNVQITQRADGAWYYNKAAVWVEGTMPAALESGQAVGLYWEKSDVQVGAAETLGANNTWRIQVKGLSEGPHSFDACVIKKDKDGNWHPVDRTKQAAPKTVKISMDRPDVHVETNDLLFGIRPDKVRVLFSTNKLEHVTEPSNYGMSQSTDGAAAPTISEITFLEASSAVILPLTGMTPGMYRLTINKKDGSNPIKDWYGNLLRSNTEGDREFVADVYKPIKADVPSVRPGITGPTGPQVDYREYTEPRKVPDGFNPSDHVETRVARLYYYRDAHRVAQIINRTTQSYNRAAVDMQRQLADRARIEADQTTDARKQAEYNAILAAQQTRRAEHEVSATEQRLNQVFEETRQMTAQKQKDEKAGAKSDITDKDIKLLQDVSGALATRLEGLRQQVEHLRERENELNGVAQQLDRREQRSREDQFRREVAAAREDPDTYAPGIPDSDDPVRQVSVSVIGEGLIQLRGPIKGINVIRQMINQIDSPVGQVRVNVHTVQINGEHGNRMEQVADRIQKHLDHSRFLTTQSAEILRRAIVKVASRRAAEVMDPEVAGSQDVRDQRYLYAFFGRDFIDELRAMDSEFLHTGNKLLSLHSMDTTSLSSALFLMALANNSTRQQILAEFQGMLAAELPAAEESYYEAGSYSSPRCTREGWQRKEKFQLFAANARFESLRGFFDAQADIPDTTMTPIQREFIRLAQIFKARLITEMELNQRIMERAIIEERLGDRRQELEEARAKEMRANVALQRAQQAFATARDSAVQEVSQIRAKFEAIVQLLLESEKAIAYSWRYDEGNRIGTFEGRQYKVKEVRKGTVQSRNEDTNQLQVEEIEYYIPPPEIEDQARKVFYQEVARLKRIRDSLKAFHFENLRSQEIWSQATAAIDSVEETTKNGGSRDAPFYPGNRMDLESARLFFKELYDTELSDDYAKLKHVTTQLTAALSEETPDLENAYKDVLALRDGIERKVEDHALRTELLGFVDQLDDRIRSLFPLGSTYTRAAESAEKARRPLDHKKFLDMLVDDLEDKFIELLEGTRAHTANIDNYIKRLATALESDFNTQFYYPSFRGVREASRYWDVNLGQIETTGILANNRAFAKVSPQATMEFDLPKRDILIAEAMNGAKAMVDDFGALVNDPSFLALAALGSGQSPASQMGGASGGLGSVRSVLPGTDSATAEKLLSQSGPGQAKLGSALESLIPDPAIYKFETGTGFEIRPVIQPDGQAVVFHLNYLYTTNVREPVRADEKHLGRVKQHFIDTDVQLSNYELREVSRYMVALKASRTARGVPLLEDVPIAGVLFRPLPQQESSLQENLILAQATIYPTLFDLMGLRWAPAVADLDPLRLSNEEFVVRNRHRALQNRVYDYSSSKVDEFLRIPEADRRPDLYRTQETIPALHPNGYQGPGLNLRDSQMQEGFQPQRAYPQQQFIPGESPEGSPLLPRRGKPEIPEGTMIERYPLDGNASKAEELSLPPEPQSRRPNASIRVR